MMMIPVSVSRMWIVLKSRHYVGFDPWPALDVGTLFMKIIEHIPLLINFISSQLFR